MKTCSKCSTELPATSEYFGVRNDYKDGLLSFCRKCRSNHDKLYYKANSAAINGRNALWQQANFESIRERKRQHYQANIEIMRERRKLYSQNNTVAIKEFQSMYYQKNRAKMIQRVKLYAKEKPEIFRVNAERRRSRKLLLPSTLTLTQWEEAKFYFNNRCAYCGRELLLQQEHFVPLSKGGEYSKGNIIPSCKRCNSSKNASNFFEWYPIQKYYSKKRETIILKFLNYKDRAQQFTLAI